VRLVHTPRAGTLGQAALRGARAPTRTPARPSTAGLCTRRRLPIPRAARGVEWLREPIPLPLQAIALAPQIALRPLDARERLAQAAIRLQQFVARQRVGRRAVRGRANAMPVPSHLYKYGMAHQEIEWVILGHFRARGSMQARILSRRYSSSRRP